MAPSGRESVGCREIAPPWYTKAYVVPRMTPPSSFGEPVCETGVQMRRRVSRRWADSWVFHCPPTHRHCSAAPPSRRHSPCPRLGDACPSRLRSATRYCRISRRTQEPDPGTADGRRGDVRVQATRETVAGGLRNPGHHPRGYSSFGRRQPTGSLALGLQPGGVAVLEPRPPARASGVVTRATLASSCRVSAPPCRKNALALRPRLASPCA
jgi:hypothetical protein